MYKIKYGIQSNQIGFYGKLGVFLSLLNIKKIKFLHDQKDISVRDVRILSKS